MSKKGVRLKEKLFSNWGLKIVSLILAFGVWLFIVYLEDPIETERFTNIPVIFLNTEILTDDGKVFEILEGTDVIRTVSIRAARSYVDQLKEEEIIATADFNELTLMNTIDIKFSLPIDYTDISSSIDLVKLNVEDRTEKYINIRVEAIGEVAEGYELEGTVPDLNRLQIWGPESRVSQVSYARAEVNVNGIASNSRTTETIYLYDADDNLLDSSPSSPLSMSVRTVSVEARIYATKLVPISYSLMGEPEEDYLMTGSSISIDEVLIAGPSNVLNSVREITIPAERLDISDKRSNYTQVIDIVELLPSGTRLARNDFDGKVTVAVNIDPVITRKLNIPRNNIQLRNIPEGFEAEIVDELEYYELEVRGLDAQLSRLQPDDMNGIVDIAGWLEESGREATETFYYIPAEFTIPEGIMVSRGIEPRISLSLPEEEE